MKKTYMHIRVGLLAGLLSFHALSSCVHTRESLGFATRYMYLLPLNLGWAHSALLGRWDVASLVPGGGILKYFKLSKPNTHTMSSCTTNRLPNDMTTEEAKFILNAIQANPGDLVPNGAPWLGNEALDNSVTLESPMVLDDQVLSDLMDEFSVERIQSWLTKGLNINAKDPLGRTLLMHAVLYNSQHVFRFLIGNGANVDAQDKDGATSLMIAVMQAIKHMVSTLLKHKADPCIKDNQGNTARSLAEAISNKHVRSEIIKILDTNKKCVA